MYIPSSALELFENYKNCCQKDGVPISIVSKTQAVLLHCVVPALKGPKPKGKRLTKTTLKLQYDFLKKFD